ncbi:NAD(P)/FAD-dependent oxidoreductase [Arthrobacter sp. OV608]|uniref:flavin-containing monooxygenase n=1 Tax=Arthrobacter sp. OV608 TaxID=1882768 RepID=UPI0008CAD4BF|nr:NAD(P)/FAD-dependent oxidoreductase [Arthrobacter sp. OV608]SER31525.1 Predicted flavoprotein CzcO associated with the cation diffusion facilitator CzcD [Arthrobacter sp. OV608]
MTKPYAPQTFRAEAVDAVAVRAKDATPEPVDTVIIGAGFAGLGAAIQLARSGELSFVVVERAADVGGTWRDNVYPGVACDIPSQLYSFSFRPRTDWSRFYPPGAEILDYLREAAREEGILPHLRFSSEVLALDWDQTTMTWAVDTTRGTYRCRWVIVATGRLSEKRVPDVPGLDAFAGPVFHSSEWPRDLDLVGKRVGLAGSGASAVQILPRVASVADEVVLFQRSAAYVVPRNDRAYTEEEQVSWQDEPDSLATLRTQMFWDAEAGFPARLGAAGPLTALRDRARRHLEAQIPDPALRRALTPDYEAGCKRVLLSDDYYPALMSKSVRLEGSALTAVEGSRVAAASGAAYELDALILATGFHSTRPPIAHRIRGRDGRTLDAAWSHGMVAYNSTTVAGFPNLFVIDGPNASLGHNSAVHMIESQIAYVLKAMWYLRSRGVPAFDVRPERQATYVTEIDRMAENTVWLTGGCRSWYVDERSRRLTLLWPDTASAFRERLARFDPADYNIGMVSHD